jgi:acetylornithine deacetylase
MVQAQRLKKLLQGLVDIYSPSGKEEDVLDYLKGYLKRRGVPLALQPVDENRYNLIAVPEETDIRLALIGHLDTVSAFDLENYGYTEHGDLVKGLGTADMKGGCAAMVEAYLSLYESGRPLPPVALCMVVGEEESGDGADELMKGYHFPWALIGEPTDLAPCLKSYGYLEIYIAALGKRMHASLAGRRENAVKAMLSRILRLAYYIEKERPDLVYNIRDLFSSQAGFAVPERCEAWLDIHLPPSAPIGVILTELEEVAAPQPAGVSDIEVIFRSTTIDAGYELPEKGSIVENLKLTYDKHNLPWKTEAFSSHSDANQIWAAGTKPILLGPGKLEKAHTEDESISFQQVRLASEIYFDFIQRMFKSQPA